MPFMPPFIAPTFHTDAASALAQVQAKRAQQARETEEKRTREVQTRLDQSREEELRQQRAQAAEQARRDQERREEVWLRQQQVNPPRPQPLGIPIRRVS